MNRNEYRDAERSRAVAWKRATVALEPAAKVAAPYVNKDGRAGAHRYDFCLPLEYAASNLLPDVRERSLHLFQDLGIPWHAGVGAGPTNHLLSSQVQCVNALARMVEDPLRARRAFGSVLDIGEMLEIEPGRFLTFEYIGPADYFGEVPGGERTRGAQCTSVDAAFLYRTPSGVTEMALVEWKYTEQYLRRRKADPAKDGTRIRRYEADVFADDGPVRADLLPLVDLLDEPFYQLVRQQLLAHRLERDRVLGADVVRVVHVLPPANVAYQKSLTRDSHRCVGATVDEVWAKLLRTPSRFAHLDPVVFLDPTITSAEYAARYGGPLERQPAQSEQKPQRPSGSTSRW